MQYLLMIHGDEKAMQAAPQDQGTAMLAVVVVLLPEWSIDLGVVPSG